MKITGLSSRMALLSSPLASAGVAGITTLSPGMWAYQLSNAWECCEASCNADPPGPRNTAGTPTWPFDM
jgi:hypothetical protein